MKSNIENELYTEDMAWIPDLDLKIAAARKVANAEKFDADPIHLFGSFIVQEFTQSINAPRLTEVNND